MRPATVSAAVRWADRLEAIGSPHALLRGPSRSGNCRKRPRLQVTGGGTTLAVTRQRVTGLIVGLIVAGTIIACGEPVYCEHYDDWVAAEAEADRIERRNLDDTRTWSKADLDSWTDATLRAVDALILMQDAAPRGASRARVKSECGR